LASGFSTSATPTFTQVYDPNATTASKIVCIICDGSRIPYYTDGNTVAPVTTTAGYLPVGVQSGTAIKPSIAYLWGYSLVYTGDSSDPGAVYIADAMSPETFTGYSFVTPNGANSYIPYYPGGQNGTLGAVTGLASVGANLVIFFTAGVVVAVNTGTYGATQFQFFRVSSSTGCTSTKSIVEFDGFVMFFGGDRFYGTDAQYVYPVNDEEADVYSYMSRSAQPPAIKNITTVVSVRRGSQYWASYDTTGSGMQDTILVFDIGANGGYTFGPDSRQNGGAWSRWPSGMPLSAACSCRGPGDTGQVYWGNSTKDQIYQHDIGTFSDDGAPIAFEMRSKYFAFDKPVNPKTVQALYVIGVFDVPGAGYSSTIIPYITIDTDVDQAQPIAFTINQQSILYGGLSNYGGSSTYGTPGSYQQQTGKGYPAYPPKGQYIGVGVTETSVNPFNVLGFVLEATIDAPEFP
jgi:hypothetical protein